MNLFTSTSCGQCHSLLQDSRIKSLIGQGRMKVTELHSVDPKIRDQLFSKFSNKRMVPFLVYNGNNGFQSLVGKDQILSAFNQ